MTRWGSIGVLTLALGVLAATGYLLRDLASWPVRSVRVAGDFEHLSRAALEEVIGGRAGQGFFQIDLDEVRRAALGLPWVKDVSVRRVWPDSLHVAVIEREAVARWGDDGLIDADGEVFQPARVPGDPELPVLRGPRGSHETLLRRYREFTRALAPAAASIRELTWDARGAWRLRLARGMALVLGREPSLDHLDRFARVLGTALEERGAQIERVDLRYASGFAVHWRKASTFDLEG
ncbi:MAG: cell division protein FtsQ/DivIB [Gammaproteobacteria bacterium]|nr:cell division protein FtsQ/DivIB [Gammaproteobacteria bacterium]NIR82261.1 cell division protein FtsQ/DivIB [Gammaproteobacteria bacterium]NIR91192.1 cell division protein FtsQ/DivIB [Gammaproteobacteria bacterium]NIU03410.1 cell division protein FtsQ/DivIB [Gammaproteobacteria bacterium]NIX84685.1 FtsQ-type POTRA domain-containing protein [Gammaproteobacteria bacterium]